MAIVFLVLYLIAEAGLLVLTFTKFKEKAKWLKNRMILSAAEAGLLLTMVLFPEVNMKWRFYGAIIILGVRFAFSLVRWLVRRGKVTGEKRKAGPIAGCVLSFAIISASLTPAFLFTNYNGLGTTGEFEVEQTGAILVDKTRVDEFENDGSYREIPVHFYYPAAKSGTYPLVVFSHGAFGYYKSNFSTYSELASHGYIVAALDHPHHSVFTKDTNGKTVIVDSKFINDAMKIGNGTDVSSSEVFNITESWMKLRTDDISFVIDSVKAAKDNGIDKSWNAENEKVLSNVIKMTDTDKIGCMGHSLGGAASVELARVRDDINAVIDLDGTVLGEVESVENEKCIIDERPYETPALILGEGSSDEEGGAYANVTTDFAANSENVTLVFFKDAGHMDFTDLCMLSPVLASSLSESHADGEQVLRKTNELVLDWFDYYLKGEGKLDIKAEY